jgi:hypothetical protein
MPKSIYELSQSELIDYTDTAPGRVRTFLLNPEKETTPHSCTLFVWNGDLADCLQFTARALKGGAGVKIVFTESAQFGIPSSYRPAEWYSVCHHSHPEWDALQHHSNFLGTGCGMGLTLKISDSMEGDTGILASMARFIEFHKSVTRYQLNLDFSDIRPIGTTNDKGLVASGAESFLSIFEAIAVYLGSRTITDLLKLFGVLNSVMRRGGYKKGIVTSSMDYRNPAIMDYLQSPLIDIDGSHKKAVIIDDGVMGNPELVDAIIQSRNSESLFIEKFHPDYPRVSANVCEGIELGHKGTCLIWRVNLGKCKLDDIRVAFYQAAINLCELHCTWRDRVGKRSEIYASIKQDPQIAIDVMGFANLLAIEGIKYSEFVEALRDFLNQSVDTENKDYNPKAISLVFTLHLAYQEATLVADRVMRDYGYPSLERIFTVEPAQNHSYETTDRLGFTTCRGIFAPYGQFENRNSDTQENRIYNHGSVETANQIGSELHKELCNLWQQMMNGTKRAHTISQDTYEPMTSDRLSEFLKSPSKTLYYEESSNFNQRTFLAKKVQVASCGLRPGECESCAG